MTNLRGSPTGVQGPNTSRARITSYTQLASGLTAQMGLSQVPADERAFLVLLGAGLGWQEQIELLRSLADDIEYGHLPGAADLHELAA
jgi:hypothetical protein